MVVNRLVEPVNEIGLGLTDPSSDIALVRSFPALTDRLFSLAP